MSPEDDEDFFSDGVEDEDDDVTDELTLGDSFFGLIRDFEFSIEWACFGLINIESWDGDFIAILEKISRHIF